MTDIDAYFGIVYDATFRELSRRCVVKAKRIQDVDDLLQNTYERFYRHIRRHGTNAVENAQAYLMTLLNKELARHYRFYARKREVAYDDSVEPLETAETPEAETLDRLTLDEIWALIESEPTMTQKVFVLFYGHDMAIAQIAAELGISEAAVKNRLMRARNKIRAKMRKEETA